MLIDANKKLSSIAVEEGKARIYDENTLLLIAIGGTIGKVAISREKSSSNQQITGIKFKKNVNVDFSYYWFITIKNEIVNQASASTLPIINQSGIKNLPFVLPPLNEQERIVQKLDTAFQSLDEAITLQKENIAHTQELKKAVLVEQISNLSCEMKDILEGVTMSNKTVIPKNDETYNYVGLENIQRDTGQLVDFEPQIGSEIKSNKVFFKKGMVLYGKLRPYLNKVHVAEFDGIATTEILRNAE